LAKLRAKFPTAAVAILQFDLPRWADVTGETGTLLAFMRPRDLA
jgi:phosphohistidine phosphatase